MTDSFLRRLENNCSERPDKVAMRIVGDASEVYTFGEMMNSIRSAAAGIAASGIGVGERVALIGENHPSWAIAYLAIVYRGAVCVPLDPQGSIETLTNFIENSEARLAFIGPDVLAKFQQIEERLGQKITAVSWGGSDVDQSHEHLEDWRRLPKAGSGSDRLGEAAGDDVALLIYTSGTTGTPKGVPLTHANILAELDGINEVLHLTDREKILSLLPLFHAYLQIVNLWVASTYGCEVGYLKELSPAALSDAMKLFRPTILTTVPRLWYLFHKKIFDGAAKLPVHTRSIFKALLAINGVARNTAGANFGRRFFGKVHDGFGGALRIAISAGSRFDEDVARDFHKLGFTILQGYGLTETSGAATATFENDNKVGSVGKPLKGAEVKIADPNAEGVGEVLIRGPMVFDGYYRNPDATAEAFTDDGWFRSGDLGRFDRDGNLFIVGRAKDVIVLPSGKNVHPEDLEVHYLRSPLIEEIAILGVADNSSEHLGAEKLAAVVVPDFEYLRSAKVANSKEAIRYALDNLGRDLPEYQRVRDYLIRAEPLPRTGSRKIKRFELKSELESGGNGSEPADTKTWQLTAEDASVLESDAAGSVVAIISQNLNESQTVHPDMNLEIDLGLDSLGRAETFAALEHTFGKTFDADEAARALTVRDLISLVSTTNGDGPSKISSNFLNWSEIIRDARPDFPEVKTILTDQPLFTAFAFFVYKCFNLFCRIFMRLEVRNVERLLEMKRPFLICPNHQSFLDPFVVCSNYSYDLFRNTFHVGASMFFQNRFMLFVARKLQVVPVDPDTQLMKAMRAGAVGLKHGRVLNIYPEGERAYDGKLHDFKKGASILSTELDLPIMPVAIDGLQNVWARKSWRIRPAKVKVTFGEPIYPRSALAAGSAAKELTGDEKYQALTSRLRSDIASMIADMRD